ncbi:CHAT domain-containing tetratricopeptide repeat protein [Streptomyces tanashiensis]|uniref:CHAT domain-containing tetratricopeptide repeat protein n=1 Tax=Streptomyces tanashiensis TaxID=67367 RepID=UPI00167CDD0A|nr:CHAT domain-containing protein [Streptomyces tanashiensis]GGY32352.1 CHAT domain-containing protein [Streptomyces tanashiensis]
MYPPDEANSHAEAGDSAWNRFERTRSPAELNSAISSFRAAVAALPADDPGRVPHLYRLLSALHLRFTETRDATDLEPAIAAGREATSMARRDTVCLSALAALLLERFKVAERKADLDEAIEVARTAARLPPSHPSDGTAALANLGSALSARFKHLGSVEDLEESIDLARTAVVLSRPGPSRKHALHNLVQGLRQLVMETGRPEALEEAVAVARRAVNARPREGSDQAVSLNGLGAALADRCELTHTPQGLDEALVCSLTAFDMTPTDHPKRQTYLVSLVVQLALKARYSGNPAHLDEAVRLARASAESAPSHTEAPAELILVGALVKRYQATGTVADLDEAIVLTRAGLARTQDDQPGPAHFSGVLSELLFLRHRQAGAVADLDEAIRHERVQLRNPALDRRRRASVLNALGLLLWARSRRTRDRDDIEASIAFCREAVATGVHRSDRAMHLSNLGNVLMARFEHAGRLEDLDEGIDLTRRAVAASTGRKTDDLARYLANLTHALTQRHKRTGRREDVEEAVSAGRRSVSLISGSHPERARFLANLGDALRARHASTGNPDDRSAATAANVEASAVDTAPVWQRLGSARAAAADLVAASDVLRATDLLQNAVRLLPEVSPRRLARSDQEYALGGLSGLAGEAASLVLADPRLPAADRPRRALSLLEAGRGVLISQALDGRDDLSALRRRHPDLAARFVELRDLLDQPWEAGPSPGGGEPGTPTVAQQPGGSRERHELAAEFAATQATIRALDGFGSFGLPPGADQLLGAAQAGPVVVLNVSAYGSHALLVTRNGVTALPLPQADADGVATNASAFLAARQSILMGDAAAEERGGARMLSVLEWLWDAIAAPVLEALGHRTSPSADTEPWPRVWWVPCGLLSLLPIHAAGHHTTAAREPCPRTVIDRVVSSYTPSLRTLIHTRQTVSPAQRGPTLPALAVAMPTTPGLPSLGRLPYVAEEVGVLRSHLPELTVLADQEAALDAVAEPTKASVLARLVHHPIAHFSCHGATDPHQPSLSRLLLSDHEHDPLTAASLAPVALDRAQLAYLSACNTAATRPMHLLDESIHLASAFQIAGFPHVISTLWEIDDQLSVRIADDFYARLRTPEDDLDVSRAAQALHRATLHARSGDGTTDEPADALLNPFLWASYVHIGI